MQFKPVSKKDIPLWQTIAYLVSSSIGAGILGVPFAVSRLGIPLGIAFLVLIGLLVMGLNLLIGEILVRTKKQMQLVGLANKYIGKVGSWVMLIVMYILSFGSMVVYLIGEGEIMAALFGGLPFWWTLAFFGFGSLLIVSGMRTIKHIELLVSIGVLGILVIIALLSTPYLAFENLTYFNFSDLLFPYGVFLFAFSSATAIPEAHTLLPRRKEDFKVAIVTSSVIIIVAYTLFSLGVVGVTGMNTSEVATVGLAGVVGPALFVLGNIFALVAMGNNFVITGLALRDSLRWDFSWTWGIATIAVCGLPILAFLVGVRGFISTIDIIGGLFVSLELILLIFIYWRAKQLGDLKPGRYRLHHAALLAIVLLIVFSIGGFFSVLDFF